MNKAKRNNLQIIGIPEVEEKWKEEQVVGNIIAENLPHSLKEGSCMNLRG